MSQGSGWVTLAILFANLIWTCLIAPYLQTQPDPDLLTKGFMLTIQISVLDLVWHFEPS